MNARELGLFSFTRNLSPSVEWHVAVAGRGLYVARCLQYHSPGRSSWLVWNKHGLELYIEVLSRLGMAGKQMNEGLAMQREARQSSC